MYSIMVFWHSVHSFVDYKNLKKPTWQPSANSYMHTVVARQWKNSRHAGDPSQSQRQALWKMQIYNSTVSIQVSLVKLTSSFIQHSLGSKPGFHGWNRCKDLADMQLLWFMEEISWLVVMSIGKCTLLVRESTCLCSISAFFRLAVLSTLSVLSSVTLLLLLCTFPYFTCKLSLFSESW